VLYLSLLSIEISLKYLLEKAGVPVKQIRRRSHDIGTLLKDLGECEVRVNVGATKRWVSASRIRARVVSPMYEGATIGSLLEGERKGASKYPSEIRYGQSPRHFPPKLMLDCAVKVAEWADEYSASIRAKKP
jgi:HEPN domain-containing protein